MGSPAVASFERAHRLHRGSLAVLDSKFLTNDNSMFWPDFAYNRVYSASSKQQRSSSDIGITSQSIYLFSSSRPEMLRYFYINLS